jgi:hypothetical protein
MIDMNDVYRRAQEKKRATTTIANGDWIREQSKQGMLDAQGRQAPQANRTAVGNVAQGNAALVSAANIATGPQDQYRQRSMALIDRINGVANGTQLGGGEMAAQREGNRAIAQQQAIARSQRGGGAAMAARGAAMNSANIGLNTAGQAAQARVQDQQIANQTMGQLIDSGRQQDVGLATSQAGFQQQAGLANQASRNQVGLANMDAKNQAVFQQAGLDQATSLTNMQSQLQQTGMNDQAALAYMAQLYGVDAAEMQARLQYAQVQAAQQAGRFGMGDLLQMGGTLGAGYLSRPQVPSK